MKCVNIFSEPDPSYTFTKPLQKKTSGFAQHEAYMECTVSSNLAIVSWYKGKTKIEVSICQNEISPRRQRPAIIINIIFFFAQDGDQISISKDMAGVCRLTFKSAKLEDSGEYSCKINKQTDKTETVLTIVGTCEKKTKYLPTNFIISRESDDHINLGNFRVPVQIR